jgi:YVTN family beta-propeller protein
MSTRLVLAGAACALAVGVHGAAAGPTAADLRIAARLAVPADVVAGRATAATLAVTRGGKPLAGAHPRVRFASDGTIVTAAGRATHTRGRYAVAFRLPVAGAWTYRVTVGKAVAGSGRLHARVDSRLPGAEAFSICADAGAFWPTMTLALDFGSIWIACKEQGRLARFDAASGRTTRIWQLGGSLIAVATGFGSVWALSSGGTLYRVDPQSGAVAAQVDVGTSRPYNIWIGAGAVWVVDDGAGEVIRIDPARNRVAARIPVGDGPADLVFDGTTAWTVNHRDLGLVRIDTATNRARRLATLRADAPERMVLAAGRLWITGRGTDLLEVDPGTGAVLRSVDIGVSGIDVVVRGEAIWVPVRSAEVDARGLPTMETLKRVDPSSGAVTATITTSAPVDVHGLAADERGVWLADNTHGVLYRVAG